MQEAQQDTPVHKFIMNVLAEGGHLDLACLEGMAIGIRHGCSELSLPLHSKLSLLLQLPVSLLCKPNQHGI